MGKASRRAARERLKQERLRAQKRAKRNRIIAVIGSAVVVVALIVGGGYFYYSKQGDDAREFANNYKGLPSQSLQQDGSVVMAKKGAKAPVVQVYADFQCPACKQFEDAAGPTLKKLAKNGNAIVHYRPVSIFAQQGEPVGSNSLRGAAAARAAADHGKYLQYNDLLFQNQPQEGQPGFDVSELKDWGDQAGIKAASFDKRVEAESEVVDQFSTYNKKLMTKAQDQFGKKKLQTMPQQEIRQWGDKNGMDSSFLDGTYVEEVLDATDAASKKEGGQFSTPTIYLNDTKLGQQQTFAADALKSAVQDAKPGEVDTEPAKSGSKKSAEGAEGKE